MARRDTSDPDDAGFYPKWAFSWPANRRILYNRASADMNGQPWDPKRKPIAWDGAKWAGYDVPDIAPTAKPDVVGPFIMNPEGTARLFTRGMMKDGPFPVHYEPFESPIANPIAPNVRGNPAARVFEGDMAQFGDADEVPVRGDLLPPDRALPLLDQACPAQRRDAARVLCRDLGAAGGGEGHRPGGWVKVMSNRGEVKAKAVVTKRIKPLQCDGKTVHIVGIPLHWGFTGAAKKGFGPNTLTPYRR